MKSKFYDFMQTFTCQSCGKEWSNGFCPECAQTIDLSLTPQPRTQCAIAPVRKPLTGALRPGFRTPSATQKALPIFGLMSVAMWALAVVGILVAYALQGMDGLALLLLSLFGPTLVGATFAVVGIARGEHPKIVSVVGLLANAAFPTIAIVLGVAISMGVVKGGSGTCIPL